MATDGVLTAPAMALAAATDPQFAVPKLPRVRRGVSIHRDGPALVVDGTPTRHRLRGRAATDLVPALLPLLDGTRDLAAIAAAAGRDTGPVFAALSLLWTCGVTEEAPPADVDASWVPDHLADHLSRVGDATQANPTWEQAAERLRVSTVELRGEGPLRAALDTALGTSLTPRTAEAPDLVVLLDPDPDVVERCWATGTPLLRVRHVGSTVDIGPYVDPALGPCLACQTAGESGGHAPGSDPVLAAGFVASDLVGLVSRAYPTPLPLRWHRVDLDRLVRTQHSGATRPGCPRCSVAAAVPEPPAATLAARYEAAVALPPRRYADLKAHQAHYQPANVALQRGHRSWPAARRLPLPAPDLDRLDAGGSTMDVEAVGLLLALSAGWRSDDPDRVRRWTASGGNIGSVVAHLRVRDVPGLEPGVYGYIPTLSRPVPSGREGPTAAHALARLHDGPVEGNRVVFTADLARVASKYGAFALRVTLLDAGCAQATVLRAAAALGVPCRAEPRWDDAALADVLAVDPDAEPITAVLALGEDR